MNLWLIFITGLTTGGLSCLAMQGGLLASVLANKKEEELEENKAPSATDVRTFYKDDVWAVSAFMLAKLASHTLFGFFLGGLGSVIALSLGMRLTFQTFAAVFMFATAMNLLNVHPIFRFMALQPPRFVQKWIHTTSKSKAVFAPALLGFLTVLIPCGVTQSMEVLAINLGNPIQGALVMFAFVLGTTPLFVALGLATVKLSENWRQQFLRVAAYVLVFMALYSVNGVLTVLDSPLSWHNLTNTARGDAVSATQTEDAQQLTINVNNNGYSPRVVVVEAGKPVELTLVTNETYSCAVAFTFKEFGISTFLKPTGSETFTFTPTKKGSYTFTCSMGMYTGTMQVI